MNRRMGGGGPRGSNRPSYSQHQQPFQSGGGGGVNPWQGGGGGVNQGSGLLSQITSNPQLALALTSLLQPQQQQQPPSLLSLNTGPTPFSNNRGYGSGPPGGRFNRGRDIRRHEPYNKNRGGFGDRRKRSPKRRPEDFKKKNEKKAEKKDENEAAEEGVDDEKKDTKRDWKDEKNTGEAKEGDEAPKSAENKDGRYGGVPSKYLNCFVCNKQMWDGESMGKHVRGRAHGEMLKALEESIHICVSILRENLRLAEERKMIEYNRQNRQRKFNQRREPPLSHCAMCDLKFMGKIISHRRTEGHQRLKRYLHPTCRVCDKEYPSRIEWVEHCLTPEHLRKVHERSEKRAGGSHGDEITEGDGELDLELEPLLEENLHLESEEPILDMDSNLDNMVSRLPAYKPDRQLAPSSLSEFSGWKCDLCHRSFALQADSEAHLTTRRHFYRFINHIKERFEKEEKKKKADKEAAEAKKKSEDAQVKEENGVKEEGDQEMYDPSETTGEEEEKANGEEAEEEEDEAEGDGKMDTSVVEEEEEEVVEVEPTPVKVVEEVKKEAAAPATPRTTRKLGGPKSKRGKK